MTPASSRLAGTLRTLAIALALAPSLTNCGGASAPPPVSGGEGSEGSVSGGTAAGTSGTSGGSLVRPPNGASRADAQALIPIDADDAVWGAPLAPVTVVEFADIECPFCSDGHFTVDELKRQYGPERLRVVFKHLPLDIHPSALRAAFAAQSVRDLGGSERFFQYIGVLFNHQRELDQAHLGHWAEEIGISPDTLLSRMHEPAVLNSIRADVALADQLRINGTPAFRVNGIGLVGSVPIEAFEEPIERELALAEELVRRGLPRDEVYRERVRSNLLGPMVQSQNDAPGDGGKAIAGR
jgi:protein-disulfide isomerase